MPDADGAAPPLHDERVLPTEELTVELLDEIRAFGVERETVSGEYLYRAGRDATPFFVVVEGSVELDGLPLDAYSDYVVSCAGLLGRAHAQSPTAGQVIGYIGTSQIAARAIVDWSIAYADQSLRDFEMASAATW